MASIGTVHFAEIKYSKPLVFRSKYQTQLLLDKIRDSICEHAPAREGGGLLKKKDMWDVFLSKNGEKEAIVEVRAVGPMSDEDNPRKHPQKEADHYAYCVNFGYRNKRPRTPIPFVVRHGKLWHAVGDIDSDDVSVRKYVHSTSKKGNAYWRVHSSPANGRIIWFRPKGEHVEGKHFIEKGVDAVRSDTFAKLTENKVVFRQMRGNKECIIKMKEDNVRVNIRFSRKG